MSSEFGLTAISINIFVGIYLTKEITSGVQFSFRISILNVLKVLDKDRILNFRNLQPNDLKASIYLVM